MVGALSAIAALSLQWYSDRGSISWGKFGMWRKSLKTFKVHSTVGSRGYPLKSLQAVLCFNPLPSFLVWEQGWIVFLFWPNKKIMRTAIENTNMTVTVSQDAEWIEHPLLMLCVWSSNPATSMNISVQAENFLLPDRTFLGGFYPKFSYAGSFFSLWSR